MKLKLNNLLPYSNSLFLFLSILIIVAVMIPIHGGYVKTLETLLFLNDIDHRVVISNEKDPFEDPRIDTEELRRSIRALLTDDSFEHKKEILHYKTRILSLLDSYEAAYKDALRNSLYLEIFNNLNQLKLEYTHLLKIRLHSLSTLFVFTLIAFLIYLLSTMGTLVSSFKERYRIQISERSRDLLQSIREKERDRLAVILHDQVLQNMAALSMQPELDQSPELKGALSDINNRLRTLIQGLHPQHLESLGLEAAVEDFIRSFLPPDTKFNLTVNMESSIETDLLPVYTILQELLLNVSEHAAAQNAAITISCADNSLEISIKDDGKGFSLSPDVADYTQAGPTLGLLQHQVQYVDGVFIIDSAPGEGCSVYILYPLKSE